jgi:hypothetical protein
MSRKPISINVQRKLWIESMGRCMNPDCQEDLFIGSNDMIEKAHIEPYYAGEDNSFENLVILCPNCHKKFDKASLLTQSQIQQWKRMRHEAIEQMFSEKYDSFGEMKIVIQPLLQENKRVYESYYLKNRTMWDRFEPRVLFNNEKVKKILLNNMNLIQINSNTDYSNVKVVTDFLQHVDEFALSRGNAERVRSVLFPADIDSIFGVAPVQDNLLPMTESLEELLKGLSSQGCETKAVLGVEHPYISICDEKTSEKVFLDDVPRIRQMYFDYHCFRKTGVRLESLNYILKCVRRRNIKFDFCSFTNLREVDMDGNHLIFVYDYCLSKEALMELDPATDSMVVNLHNWNGDGCISNDAYSLAVEMGVRLFTTDKFLMFLRSVE